MDQVDAPAHLEIETEERDGVHMVRLSGEVDLSNAALLRAALDKAHTCRHAVLDCQRLTYMDSTGLSLLQDLSKKGGRFALVAPSPTIRKILEITHLDTLIPILPSVEEALKALEEKTSGPVPSSE